MLDEDFPLLEEWLNIDPKRVGDFLASLRIPSTLGVPPLESLEIYSRRLQDIEASECFHVLKKDEAFVSAYAWVCDENAPEEFQSPEGKIKFLECVAVCLTLHVYETNGKAQDFAPTYEMTSKAAYNLVRDAKKLAMSLEQFQPQMNIELYECCKELLKPVEQLARYQYRKATIAGDTQADRRFLDNLVIWFNANRLDISNTLIQKILSIITDSGLISDDSNLSKAIHTAQEKSDRDWERLRGLKETLNLVPPLEEN